MTTTIMYILFPDSYGDRLLKCCRNSGVSEKCLVYCEYEDVGLKSLARQNIWLPVCEKYLPTVEHCKYDAIGSHDK